MPAITIIGCKFSSREAHPITAGHANEQAKLAPPGAESPAGLLPVRQHPTRSPSRIPGKGSPRGQKTAPKGRGKKNNVQGAEDVPFKHRPRNFKLAPKAILKTVRPNPRRSASFFFIRRF